jgi:predicted flap endonuclease-1-like 5' DNA nuclease
MTLFLCIFWWFVLGVLVGWLLSWLLGKVMGRGEIREASAVTTQAALAPAPRTAADNLSVIEGIGPKLAELLRHNGIDSYRKLAEAEVSRLWSILEQAGPRFRLANPGTWPEQAAFCVRGDWDGLKRWQDELYGGVVMQGEGRAAVINVGAARAAGIALKSADDLEVIEGIGPKIAALLREHGITTFAHLAAATGSELRGILDKAGSDYRIAEPKTWPEQAGYCVRNDWAGLKALQDRLTAGRE